MGAAEDTPALTLELGPGKVPYRDFQQIVRAFTGLLSEISEEACGDANAGSLGDFSLRGQRIDCGQSASGDRYGCGRPNSGNRAGNRPGRIRRRLQRFPRAVPATRLLTGADRRDILAENRQETDRHPSQIAEYGTVEGTPRYAERPGPLPLHDFRADLESGRAMYCAGRSDRIQCMVCGDSV